MFYSLLMKSKYISVPFIRTLLNLFLYDKIYEPDALIHLFHNLTYHDWNPP